ncbi:MAG: hypothetical protein K2F95_06390 [Alistipes sp.]|nr:hypothetical protein [Alistipes sp.]
MKRRLPLLFTVTLLAGWLATSCEGSDDPTPPVPDPPQERSHTLIVYMMGDNGLETFMDNNLVKIMSAADAIPEDGHIAVFYDRGNYTRLTEIIVEDGMPKQRIIEEFNPSQSTVDPQFMADVLAKVRETMPAESYGLVLSSHGGGWVPSDIFDLYLAEASAASADLHLSPRYFGQDGYDCMEIPDLVTALSDMHFDYILFDACFMASVEALYDLRETADRIIASPAEIMGSGFPYKDIVPLLFTPGHSLTEVCETFMSLYRNSSGTISLFDCSALDGLAQSMKRVMAAGHTPADVSSIQGYEGFDPHLYFDLEQYVESMGVDSSTLADFRKSLTAAVIWHDHTPTFYSDYGSRGNIDLPRSCGVSCHVPHESFPQTHAAYLETAWAKATGN